MADHFGRPFKRLFDSSPVSSRFSSESNYSQEPTNSISHATRNLYRPDPTDNYYHSSSNYPEPYRNSDSYYADSGSSKEYSSNRAAIDHQPHFKNSYFHSSSPHSAPYPNSSRYYSETPSSREPSFTQAPINHPDPYSNHYIITSSSYSEYKTPSKAPTNKNFKAKKSKAFQQPYSTAEIGGEDIRQEFLRLEGEFLENWKGNSNNDQSARLAFVDHLVLLKQEAAEKIKEKYQNLLEIYKINNKFQSYIQVSEYLECRVDLQTATGVYIPNIVEPDLELSDVWQNKSIKSLTQIKRKKAVRLRRKLNVQKDILFQSRCTALGLALANRSSSLKDKLYRTVKDYCFFHRNDGCSDPKRVIDVFEMKCSDIGKAVYKMPKSMGLDPDILMKEMISSIQSFPGVESLMSIYSPSFANINSVEDFKAIALRPIVSRNKSCFKRQMSTMSEETVQSQNFKRRKFESFTDEATNTSLSNSTIDPDLKYIEELIERKEQGMHQVILNYNRDILKCHVALTKNMRFNGKDWRLLSKSREVLMKKCGIMRPIITSSWTQFDLKQFLVDENNFEDKKLRYALNALKTATMPSHIKENLKKVKNANGKTAQNLRKKIIADLEEYANQLPGSGHLVDETPSNPFKWVAKK